MSRDGRASNPRNRTTTLHETVDDSRHSRQSNTMTMPVPPWPFQSAAHSKQSDDNWMEPFATWPEWRSALGNLGGTEAPEMHGYAFHTNFVRAIGSRLRFTLRLEGLENCNGDLVIQMTSRSPQRGKIRSRIIKRLSMAKLMRCRGTVTISVFVRRGALYALQGRINGADSIPCSAIHISVEGAPSLQAIQDNLSQARQGFLAEPGRGVIAPFIANSPPTLIAPISQMCTASQMSTPLYRKWCKRIGQAPAMHRKQWEFIYIIRTLLYYGALGKSSRGLGFGVGVEPLPSYFAAAGCRVLATDLPNDDERAQLWSRTNQHGAIERLHYPAVCGFERFRKRVSFRHVDMNAIPKDLRDFDFTWSSCAMEHLGSIEKGLMFFENSLECLRPGGIAVHTTEFNMGSNEATLDNDSTVLFRRRDFERLAERLARKGHRLIPLTFDSGETELDDYIDFPPYSSSKHLRLNLMSWTSTSFGLAAICGSN